MMSTLQSYIYQDLNPKIEKMDTPESHLLIVHIPDGFARGDIGAKVEYDFGRVRVFGERSSGSNRRIRFNEKYQVPSHCDIGNIKGKFDGKTITITMPNIPSKAPQQEQKPIEDDNATKINDQKDQQSTSGQDGKSNVESKEDATPQEGQKVTTPQKGREENSEEDQVTKDDCKGEAHHENSTSQEVTKESVTQQGRENFSQKETLSQKVREEISQNAPVSQKDHGETSQKEFLSKKVKEEISREESLPQKSREEVSKKELIPEKGQQEISHHETSKISEGSHESMPQKSQDQGTTEKVAETKDAKLQTEETTSSLKDESKENQKLAKEETKEHLKETIESENPYVADDSSPILEKKSKESATVETFPLKKTCIEKGKEMIHDKFGDDDAGEKKNDKKSIHESTTKRIKDMALSTTQAVTNYAKRFNEEDKQKLIYTGATILVVALGVYASYKYRSSRRP